MQITNQHHLSSSLQNSDAPIELKQGEVYKAQIKEKLNDSEALISIRGREIKAKFEGGVPEGDRPTVQVTGKQDQFALVKEIVQQGPKGQPKQSSEAKAFTSVGVTDTDSPQLRQAVKLIFEKGQPLSKEVVQELKSFFEKAEGNSQNKSDTVKALVNKGLEVTQTHLRSIHEALHGKPLNEVLTSIAKEVNPAFDPSKDPNKEFLKQKNIKIPELVPSAVNKAHAKENVIQASAAAPQSRSQNDLSETIVSVRKLVEKEPDLQKAIQKVKDEIIANPKIEREQVKQIEKAASEAEKLQMIGKERLVQALKNAEAQILAKESVPKAEQVNMKASSEPVSLKGLVNEVRTNPNLQKSIEKVQTEIARNHLVPVEKAAKVEKAIHEATVLLRQGRITTGKEVLSQALLSVENEVYESKQMPKQYTSELLKQTEAVRQVREVVQQEPRLQKPVDQVRDLVVNNPRVDREVAQKVERAVREAVQLQKIGQESVGRERLVQALNQVEVELSQVESRKALAETRPIETVRQAKEALQQEPKLQKAVELVRDQVVNNSKVEREIAHKVERAVRESVQLQQIGRESAGRERLVQALNQAEVELSQSESRKSVAETRPSEIVKQVKEAIQQEPRLQKAIEQVRDQVVNNPRVDREAAQKIERAVREAVQLQQIGRESAGRERLVQALNQAETELSSVESRKIPTETRLNETIKQVKEAIQQEPRLQKAIEQVRDQVINNSKVDREVVQKVERAVREAVQLQQIGREGAGRERLVQALNQAEAELSSVESRKIPTETRLNETIKQVKEAVQQEPRLQKAIEQVRDQVVNNPKIDREVAQKAAEQVREQVLNNSKINPDVANKVDKALQEADLLQKAGSPAAGHERIIQALSKAEAELAQMETGNKHRTEQIALKEKVKQIREQFQTEPDIKKVIPKIQDQIVSEKRIDPEIAKNIEKAVNQANQLDQAGRDRLVKMLQQVEQSLKRTDSGQQETNQPQRQVDQTQNSSNFNQSKVNSMQREENQLSQVKLPSETIKQALKQFQSQADMEEALNLVRKEISSNPNIDLDLVSKVDKAIEHAQQLNEKGREMAARQLIGKELSDMQQTVAKLEPKKTNEKAAIDPVNQYDLNEQLQSLSIQSKDILVTKITQKLAEVTNEFRDLKKEISRSLDSVNRIIDTYKQNAYPQAKQMLENAISKLDNTILKSDIMLFTDMKTERRLLQASSELAQAKKLLAKGDFSQASKIVGEVKELIDKINFKPSEQKIMHFVGKESMALENKSPFTPLETAARGFTMPEPSARQMFETVRTLGLNHDSDLANSLVFKNGDQSQQEQQQHLNNMKAVLMKLQNEEAGSRVAQQAEQALNNLTGQQLLSKSDSQGTLQSMLFNLPMLLGGDPENIQVYVNSKSEGQQVDWENCNLYFLLETKKLGDVGIMLTSTDRNLSITIKNDKPGFKEKMEPIASLAKERLKDIGYNIGSLQFTRMTPLSTNLEESQDSQTAEQKPKRPIFTEKGMDFKI